MTIHEFEEWLMALPLQTLTDELKEEILEGAKQAVQDASEETKLRINREVIDFIRERKRK